MQTSIKQFQKEIADILNNDPWFSNHGVVWLPEDTLNVEYEIKKNLGRTGMVAMVTTPNLNYQGEHESIESRKNYEKTDGEVSFTVTNLGDPQDTRGLLLVTNPFSNRIDGHKIYFSRWVDGNPLELEWKSENRMYVAIVDDVFNGFIPPIEGSTTWFVVGGTDEFQTDENPFEPDDFSVQWTIKDQQGRTITIQETDESPLPHDLVDYIEWTGLQYFDTGVTVGPNTRIEAKFSNFPAINQISYPFAVEDTNAQRAIFYQMTASRFGLYLTNASIDFGNASHVNVSLDLKNGGYTFNGTSGSLVGGLGQRTVSTLTIGTLNYNGTPKVEASYIVRPGTRIERFKIFEDDVAVRDLIPVVKDGVACLFDQVTSQYFYNANTEEQTPMVAGPAVQKTYYKILGGCFGTGYIIVEPNEQTTTISGTSEYTAKLTMDAQKPVDITMSKRTCDLIGKPFDAFVQTCTNYPVNDLPYDAEIEYLQSTGTQYINTGVNYEPGIRVELDVAMGATGTVPIFGARTTANTSKCYAAFYYNTTSSHSRAIRFDYCASNTATPDKTQNYTPNDSIPPQVPISLTFNGPTLTYPGGTTTATLSDQTFSADYPMYLFAVNTGGTATLAESTLNIYGCRIYNGETLVRDFIPVRVGQVAYLYDRVSGNIFGNEGTGYFVLGDDTLVNHRYGIVDTGITPDENTDMELELYGSENVSGVQIVAGTRTAANRNCYCVGFYMPNYSVATTRGRARYDWGANSAATVDMYSYFNFPVTIGFKEKRRYMNGAGSTAYTNASPVLSDLPVWLYCWNQNNDTQRVTFTTNHAWMTLGKVRFWRNGTLVAELIPVSKDGVGMYWDTVAQQLHPSLTAPLTAGTVIPTPETTDESEATFTDTVVVVNKGFDVEVSLQVVENPTVNRGKPDKDSVATALDIAHQAIYTLAGFDTEHYNDFSPSTCRQTTVAAAGNKLLQVDARFRATPVL